VGNVGCNQTNMDIGYIYPVEGLNMTESVTPMPESLLSVITKAAVPLYAQSLTDSGESLQAQLFKGGRAAGTGTASRQGLVLGEQDHPFDFDTVKSFLTTNEYHSTCIYAKVSATVGLGLIDGQEEVVVESSVAEAIPPAGKDVRTGLPAAEQLPMPKTRKQYVDAKADAALNPLCDVSFADLINDVCEDFWQTGNGYIEVVRNREGNEIVGLFHIPSTDPVIFLEDVDYNYHYVLKDGMGSSDERRFARFGDWEEFEGRSKDTVATAGVWAIPEEQLTSDTVSEVIHFRQPTSLSRWYGFPKWLSAVPAIELAQMLLQWKYDFFQNRGVPEFIFLLVGQKLKAEDWTKIEDALRAHIGTGNSHKSLALNISNPEVKAQVEKLAMESKGEDTFDTTKTSLGLSVVTAHQTPPLLAGILVPGKLGATNELPNALAAFQLLLIGPAQRLFQQTLGVTLGGENGVDGLSVVDFAFTKITEEIEIGSMDTVARMRQSPMQAASEGRDLGDGVKE
jgi:hypothetical protein